MELDDKVEDINAVSENLRHLYVQSDDGFVLKLDAVVPKSEVERLNTSIYNLENKNRELINEKQRVDQKAQTVTQEKTQGEITLKSLAQELQAIKDENNKLKTETKRKTIEQKITETAIANGARESAIPDIISRASSLFKDVDESGNPVAVNADGTKYINPKDPTRDFTPVEWLTELSKNADHLFKTSSGGGSDNSTQGFGIGQKTISTADFNARRSTDIELVKQVQARKIKVV